MRKDRIRFVIYNIPAFLYAALIFYVSGLPNVSPPDLGVSWDDKIYHFGEYFVFSILINIALRYYSNKRIRTYLYLIAALISIVFAVTDEVHQYFVPGRETAFLDFLADSLGTIAGQLFLWLYFKLRSRQKAFD